MPAVAPRRSVTSPSVPPGAGRPGRPTGRLLLGRRTLTDHVDDRGTDQMNAGRLLGGRYRGRRSCSGTAAWPRCTTAVDTRLGREVAIKMLRADLARDATFQMRFSREAQNAAALNHPAIVAVYDTGEERGRARRGAALHRHGVRQRPDAQRGADRRGAAAAATRAGDQRRHLRGARVQPPARHHPPGHQARQRHADPRPARSRSWTSASRARWPAARAR